MTLDDLTTRALRELDAATGTHDAARRDQVLARVLASPPAPDPRPRRRVRPRLLLAGGALALVTVVAVPLLTGGDEAFAGWSATPQELTGNEFDRAVRDCAASQEVDGAAGVLAERRGGWTYVVLDVPSADGILEGTCLTSSRFPDIDMGGLGERLPLSEIAPDVVAEDILGTGTTKEGLFSYTQGRAGTDVVAVTITTPGGLEIEATLRDGRYAAWWPGGEAKADSPEFTRAPVVRATLRDGSAARVD